MTQQTLIDAYFFGCVAIVSAIGIVGSAALKAFNIWLNIVKLKPMVYEFFSWKSSEEGRKARERLMSRTQNSDKSRPQAED